MWLTSKRDYRSAVSNILPVLFSYSEVRGKSLELIDMLDKMLKALEESINETDQRRTEIILRTARGAFYSDGGPIREAVFEGLYPMDREGIQRAWSLSEKPFKLHELGFWGILLSFIHGRTNEPRDAILRLQQALPYFQEKSQFWELATAKLHLASLLLTVAPEKAPNTNETVDQYLTEALDMYRSIGDKINSAHTLRQMGNLRMREQKLNEAIQQWNAAHSTLMAMDVNEWSTASSIHWQIGDAYLQLGRFDEAYQCFQDISRVNLEHGFIQQAIVALSKESFEKARYGDLTDALRLRQQCLELIQGTGPTYQIAWNEWEMGELMRLTGRLEEATQWFEHSRELFEKYQDPVGLSFCWRGVGDISLIREDYNTATQDFSRSVELARRAQHNWVTAYSLNGLGKAALGQNDINSAEANFTEAMQLANKSHDPGINLLVLNGIAHLFLQKGKMEDAVELGGLILNHFASWRETKAQASSLMSSIYHTMLPRKFNDLKKKGEAQGLWETVEQVINNLEE